MKSRIKWARVLALLGALSLAVPWTCARPAQSATRPAKTRSDAKYEAWLEKQVRHELLMLPYYSVFDNLEFQIRGDRVILLGQVVRPSTRSDAEAQVKKIEGVTGVVNRIEVLPLSPFDDRIRRAEFRAIFSNGMLNRYAIQPVPPIHIIVKGGHVTLEGVVASEAEKNTAYIVAGGVPGVFSVTNHLRVEG